MARPRSPWRRILTALAYIVSPPTWEPEAPLPGWRFTVDLCAECGKREPVACWGPDELGFRFCERCVAYVLNHMAAWHYRKTRNQPKATAP